jgi:cytoskeletal protein CcmA (bactofilin family)
MFNNSKDKKELEELSNKKNQIEKGTKITSDIETHGNIRLDGELVGNIHSESKVVLGPTCKVTGNIYAQNAEISGEVEGKIEIVEMLTLKATAVINGEIQQGKITIEPGAVINVTSKMGAVVKDIKSGGKESQEKERHHEQKTA